MAAPNISFSVEPTQLDAVTYLRCAPATAGGPSRGIINLRVVLTNIGPAFVMLTKLEIAAVGSATPAKSFSVSNTLSPNASLTWTQPDDFVFDVPPSTSFRMRAYASGFSDPAEFNDALKPHKNPTADGSYRFWAAVRDLRPGEFWQVHGTAHAQAPAQLFAYDVGVSVDNGGNSYTALLPNTDGSKNEHSRIWGKPIYAIADGAVRHFRNDFPENAAPSWPVAPNIAALINQVGDGSGNFFTVETGNETVSYCHMQKGSLNPALLSAGAQVTRGMYLGLAGNSGNSSGPHLHIHANRSNTGSQSWDDAPRPMTFSDVRTVAWSSLSTPVSSAPWSELAGRGIPPTDCAVWPSGQPVVALKNAALVHFAISAQGQPWLITLDKRIRTSTDRLPGHGLFLDVDPSGLAKEIDVYGQKPYVIGSDDRLWEGTPAGWVPVGGSPLCKRIAIDQAMGTVWAVASNNHIFSFTPATKVWKEHPGGGLGKDICAHAGTPYIIGMDDHVWESVGAFGWTSLGDGQGKRITIDSGNGTLWVIGMNDGIWSHLGGGNWSEHAGGGRAKDIQIHQHVPYVRGMDDGLWQSAGAYGWQRLNLIEPA